MCHDPASRPPAPPQIGPVGDSGQLTLISTDGTEFSAAFALPAVPARAAVVVLPDVRGLHGYYIELTKRLAEAGLAAIAIDYFGRTGGLVDKGGRTADFEFMPHITQTTPEAIDADTHAAIDYIRTLKDPAIPVVSLGFCFGGSNTWRQSAGSLDLAGCIGFYGQPGRVGDAADHAVKPTLMLIAGADASTPLDQQLLLVDRMRAGGAEITDVVFAGAPHSFFDRSYGDWSAACDEAWREIIDFVDRVS